MLFRAVCASVPKGGPLAINVHDWPSRSYAFLEEFEHPIRQLFGSFLDVVFVDGARLRLWICRVSNLGCDAGSVQLECGMYIAASGSHVPLGSRFTNPLQAVHELIADVIWIDSELHRRSHSDSTATALQRKLCDWLKKCKRVFTCTYEEDEDFGFMKFHFAAMHMYWLITEFGPLWTTCTAHMEELHKVVT